MPGRDACPVHSAYRVAAFMSKCPKCNHAIMAGDYVTFRDTVYGGAEQQHAVCPTTATREKKPTRDLLSAMEAE